MASLLLTNFFCSFSKRWHLRFQMKRAYRKHDVSADRGKVMKPEVELYDTTLRDGSQGEGINFSVADKIRIAERIDTFGIHYIEGGWPGSNPKDIEFFEQAKRKKFRHALLAAFGSTRRKSMPVEKDEQVRLLLGAETPVVTIVGKTWILH